MYINTNTLNLTSNENLDQYIVLGNEAIKNGEIEECVSWYKQGLAKARELNNSEKVKELSILLFTLF
ncbi:MAG: hypothetical protein QNK23_09490 [Crocinitomicaceae bacterium]|nr:hypothetical protein [Crocinitomicaceae bacterium]